MPDTVNNEPRNLPDLCETFQDSETFVLRNNVVPKNKGIFLIDHLKLYVILYFFFLYIKYMVKIKNLNSVNFVKWKKIFYLLINNNVRCPKYDATYSIYAYEFFTASNILFHKIPTAVVSYCISDNKITTNFSRLELNIFCESFANDMIFSKIFSSYYTTI